MRPLVFLIGLGRGRRDLSQETLEAVEAAQVLAGGQRLLDLFPNHPGQRLVLKKDLTAWLDSVEKASQEKRAAVLASGDPLFFGVGRKLIEKLGAEKVDVFPNITSIQAAFALLKEPWDGVETVSLHGRGLDRLWAALDRAGLGEGRVALLTDPRHAPGLVARRMLDRGQTGWRMAILENMGQEDRKAGEYSLAEAASGEFSPLNVVVLKKTGERPKFSLGLAEEEYEHQAGLITKAEVRAVALGMLELGPGLCLWDLGAGCGSVGLEAGLLLPGGRVAALEKNKERVAQIRVNQKKFQAAWLEVVEGEMPEALSLLPDPDRVFIGGGGRNLEEIISLSAERLSPGGVVVVSLVMLESLEAARRALDRAGLEGEAVQVQISRSGPLAQGTMLKALNPVWLVKGRKKEEL